MVSIIYCTRKSNDEHKNHLIKTSGLHNKVEVIEIINNEIKIVFCILLFINKDNDEKKTAINIIAKCEFSKKILFVKFILK